MEHPVWKAMLDSNMTIREAFVKASSFLTECGITEPQMNVERLLCHVLEWSRTELFLEWQQPFPEEKRESWEGVLKRKAAGEPVQYITGEQEFYGLSFVVTPAVLIPRPETELLVERVLALGDRLESRPLVVADIGCGSGAIAVTIAALRPQWRVAACDISCDALEMAKRNARNHQVLERMHWKQGDLLEPLIVNQMQVDILVANPPYIPSHIIETLQQEVRAFEPRLALDGGEDGLTLYRRMITQMAELPAYPSIVGFEVGEGQAEQVQAMLALVQKWNHLEIVNDFAGIGRHVIAYSTIQ